MLYHFDKPGPHADVLDLAIKHCASLAVKQGMRQMAIAVHTKQNLATPIFFKVLTEPLVRELQKRNEADLRGFTVYLMTERIKPRRFRGPVIAPHISPRYLAAIQNEVGVTDVVYVPWTPKELEQYQKKYDSVLVGGEAA